MSATGLEHPQATVRLVSRLCYLEPTNCESLSRSPVRPDKSKPEFTWVLCKWHRDDDDGSRYQMPELDTIIGSDSLAKSWPIQYNSRLKKSLPNTLVLKYRDTFLVDGSRPSRSIASITATQPGEYHDWRGPIVAYARDGPEQDPPACKDIDMVDFRHVTDYFLSYLHSAPKAEAPTEHVKGVRINCVGDMKKHQRPPFEAIDLPPTHPIFSHHDTSDIAAHIGLPLLTQRCASEPTLTRENVNATFLHLSLDRTAEWDTRTGSLGWGWSGMRWQNDVGSVLAVRADKRPLLPLHVDALASYCRCEVGPLLAHSLGEFAPEEPIAKEHVLSIICRPMFVLYWSRFLAERNDFTTPSPYDVVL